MKTEKVARLLRLEVMMQLFSYLFSALVIALPFAACGDDGGTTGDDTAIDETSHGDGDTAVPDDSAADSSPDDAAVDSDDAAVDSDDAAVDSDDAAVDSDDVAIDSDDVAVDSDDVAVDSDDVAVDSDDVAVDSDDSASETDITVATPSISLLGPDGPLTDGATIDVGEQDVGAPFTRVYTISNDGDGPLTVTGVTFAKGAPENCEQALTQAPDAVVAPGDSTDFAIEATVPDEGPANCPFVVLSDDPDHGALAVDVAAAGVAPEPTVKKSATATCGSSSGFGFLVAVLADFTPDGGLVTTNTFIDNCSLTTQVGTLPGGTTVNEAADSASCGALTCTESGANECRGLGGNPAGAGSAVTISMTDTLLGGTVSHAFPKAPGTLTRSSVGASVSRGAPLTITTSGGVAGTLTLVTINQTNDDGQTTLICEFPAESPSVSIPASLLAYFHDGAFNLLVDTRVQSFAVANGYDVALVYANSTLPQQSSFTP